MHLPYKKQPPNVTVTGITTEADAYAYATDHALVAIPEACYMQHKEKIAASKELKDRQPGGPTGMRYLYTSDLEGGYETVAAMIDCACGRDARGLAGLVELQSCSEHSSLAWVSSRLCRTAWRCQTTWA